MTNFLNVCDVFSKCTDTFSLKKSTLFLNIYGHPALKLGQPILQGGGGFSSRSGHSQGGGLSGVRPFSTGGGVGGAFNCGQAILQGCCGEGGGGLLFSVQPFCMEGKACTANAGNHSEKLTDCFVKVARILRKRLIILRKYVDFFPNKMVSKICKQLFFRNLQRET